MPGYRVLERISVSLTGNYSPMALTPSYTSEIMNTQDIVLTALPGKGRTGRLEVISPFAEVLPAKLPKLRLAYDEEALIERSIGAQLHHILSVDSTHEQAVLEQLHDFTPSLSYNLDEYVRFNTVREAFVEFVMGSTRKQGGWRNDYQNIAG